MRCTRCAGLVLERYGQWACINCGHDPFLVLITVKCATVDCRQFPEFNGYCLTCWHSRKRSELSDQERSKRYRERMRDKQQRRRARVKGAVNAASLYDSEHELPRIERDYQSGKGTPDGLQQHEEAMG